MGGIYKYKCSKCGFEKEEFFAGVSGMGLRYRVKYCCEIAKDITSYSGDGNVDGGPPDTIDCPFCKNHQIKRWDYKTCPACLQENKMNQVGHWD